MRLYLREWKLPPVFASTAVEAQCKLGQLENVWVGFLAEEATEVQKDCGLDQVERSMQG